MRSTNFFDMKRLLHFVCFATFLLVSCSHASDDAGKTTAAADTTNVARDPLPSWNDPLKGDIMAYVTKVSKEKSPDFIPVKDRIATIDNDGTLWAEKPFVQELFAYYRVKKLVTANPALAKNSHFSPSLQKTKPILKRAVTRP
jgi:hypothetical protein